MSDDVRCEACGLPVDPAELAFVGSDPLMVEGESAVYGFAWHRHCEPEEPGLVYEYVNRRAREIAALEPSRPEEQP